MNSTHTAIPPPSASGMLTRLPSVLVHLVMQQLQIEELAPLASTCKMMRADALHPSAGRCVASSSVHVVSLLSSLSAVDCDANPAAALNAVYSPLGRVHLRVTLGCAVDVGEGHPLAGLTSTQRVAALADKAAGWSHVETLNLRGAASWPEHDAIAFLQSPLLQRVRSVDEASGVWLREAVQCALCRLPLLSSLMMGEVTTFDVEHPSLRLHPGALRQAAGLRSIAIDWSVATDQLAGLICLPALTSLTLIGSHRLKGSPVARIQWLHQFAHATLSRLRTLRLTACNLSALPRKDLRSFLRAMPQLRYLHTDQSQQNQILRGLIDSGPASLLELRVVRFSPDDERWAYQAPLDRSMLCKFLSAFTRARYCSSIADDDDDFAVIARWPRVCTHRDHAEPGPEGLAGECSTDTDFDRPAPSHAAMADAAAAEAESDSDEWTGVHDPASVYSYFVNKRTGQSAWNHPNLPLEDEPEPTPLSVDEALSIIEAAYASALLEAGPWIPPLLASEDESRR